MKLLTVKQVAEKYNVTERTVRRWIKEEGLPHKKFMRSISIDPSELQQWEEKRTDVQKP